jgi:hypothetical protein
MTYWGFGLYCPTYDWINTSSWYCSRYYCRDAPRRKTTVHCDIENRCRPSLFDIWGLHRFYRNALTGYGSYLIGQVFGCIIIVMICVVVGNVIRKMKGKK